MYFSYDSCTHIVIGLITRNPEAFEEAKAYEKNALDHGSPFTWTKGEPLGELERPERMAQILQDFERRKARDLAKRPINPLRPIESIVDIDDLYGEDEGGGACVVCHK